MKNHYLQLFKYDDWASEKIISALVQQQIQDEKILKWLSHIISAQQAWLARVVGEIEPQVWETRNLEQCAADFNENKIRWLNYLESTDDEDFSETQIKDILTHVVNHSTYHRGQITAILKNLSDQVPSTDFIFYLREL